MALTFQNPFEGHERKEEEAKKLKRIDAGSRSSIMTVNEQMLGRLHTYVKTIVALMITDTRFDILLSNIKYSNTRTRKRRTLGTKWQRDARDKSICI